MDDVKNHIISLLDAIIDFLNEPFTITVIATLAAAFAGAYGAQLIAEKTKKKESLLNELRNTNAAIMASFYICNSCLSLKKQYVKLLKESHDKTRDEAISHREGIEKGTIPPNVAFEFSADLQTLSPLLLPIEALEKQVFEQISASGRALGVAVALISAIQSLNISMQQRNDLVQEFRPLMKAGDEKMANLYFGFPDSLGNLDRTYPDIVNSIYMQTDDCIFFSILLCSDLNRHGENLKSILKDNRLSVNKPDFANAEEEGLMPDKNNYTSWLTMFNTKNNAKSKI